MGTIDISITRGDTRVYQFDLVDDDGEPADLTGGSLEFTVRDSVYSTDTLMELVPVIGGGPGEAILEIPAAETLAMANEWHTLVCDLRYTDVLDRPITPMTGVLRVAPSFTADESA